jgi:phage gpG-like protein
VAGIIVDQQAMGRAQRAVSRLAHGEHLPMLAQLVAAGGLKLTMDCFRQQRDPYLRPWQPLARERTRDRRARLRAERRGKKSRGQRILIDTSRMRNSATPVQEGNAGGVAIATGYAASHQYGAKIHRQPTLREQATRSMAGRTARSSYTINIPQRMMLPDPTIGLPNPWRFMVQYEGARLMQRIQRGG